MWCMGWGRVAFWIQPCSRYFLTATMFIVNQENEDLMYTGLVAHTQPWYFTTAVAAKPFKNPKIIFNDVQVRHLSLKSLKMTEKISQRNNHRNVCKSPQHNCSDVNPQTHPDRHKSCTPKSMTQSAPLHHVYDVKTQHTIIHAPVVICKHKTQPSMHQLWYLCANNTRCSCFS